MDEKITMNAREINTAARNIIDRLDDERVKQHGTIMNYRDEVASLQSQLQDLKEAGLFLDELVQLANEADKADDDYWLMDCYGGKIKEVEIGQLRRLAEAVDKIEKVK